MIVKIFKAVWFISLLAAVGVLLFAYAGFPDVIILSDNGTGPVQSMGRNELFYAAVGLLAIFNVMVFLINRFMAAGDEFFQAWFYGLVICFNVFTLVALEFFNLYNSQERYDYDSIGYIIYGSVGLIVLWASLWPDGQLVKMFMPKREVAKN